LTNSEGMGYYRSDGSESFTFFTGGNWLTWSSVKLTQALPSDSAQNQRIIDFGDGIRFGEHSRAAIDYRVAEPISIRAGVDWQQIYVRHMFWYWGVSQVISGIADGAAAWFVNEIGRNSPKMKPIMHFILRNGVAMGFKALRKDQMNWPFNTEAPLNVITYNIAVGIHF